MSFLFAGGLVACTEYYPAESVSVWSTVQTESVISTSDAVRFEASWTERCSDGPSIPILKGTIETRNCTHADFSVEVVCDRPGCSAEVYEINAVDNTYAIDVRTPETAGPLHIEIVLTHAQTGEPASVEFDLEIAEPARYELRCFGHVDPSRPDAADCESQWSHELALEAESGLSPSFAVELDAYDSRDRRVHFHPLESLEGGGSEVLRRTQSTCLGFMSHRCIELAGPGTVGFEHHGQLISLELTPDGRAIETRVTR